MTAPQWVSWWLFGALTGMTMLSVMRAPIAFPLALAGLVVIVARSPERAALGGGALVPTGVWFLYQLRAAVERCAEMDRSPTGSCSIYGVEEQGIAMLLYLAVGLGLTLYAALPRRRPTSNSLPPPA